MPDGFSKTPSVEEVINTLNKVAGPSGFCCTRVSWEDAQRGHTANGGLSCIGPNIADVRLKGKDGQLLYTLRSNNWNERLGYVDSSDVMLMTGNERGSAELNSVSLSDYLRRASVFGSYAGLETPSLFKDGVDELFSIRFQAVFLPIGGQSQATEFCTEVYSYQTNSPSNPRNLLLLATPQGTSMQEDTPQAQRLFYHSYNPATGTTNQYWLEAEESDQAVGGAQEETLASAQAAAARGKAVAVHIGPSAMGTRFNVQMLIQVPLKQVPRQQMGFSFGFPAGPTLYGGRGMMQCDQSVSFGSAFGSACGSAGRGRASQSCMMMSKPVGTSQAARVSRGSLVGTCPRLPSTNPQREESQHGTITVTLYYTVRDGVPSEEDVRNCVKDLDALFKAMPSDKRLVNCHEVTKPAGPFGPFFPAFNGADAPMPPVPSHLVASRDIGPSVTPSVHIVKCPAGHPLRPFHGAPTLESAQAAGGYVCDLCGKASPTGIKVGAGCRMCDFDLCAQCYSHALKRTNVPDTLVLYRPFANAAGSIPCTFCHTPVSLGGVLFVPAAQRSHAYLSGPVACMHCYLGDS